MYNIKLHKIRMLVSETLNCQNDFANKIFSWNLDSEDCESRFKMNSKLCEDQNWKKQFANQAIEEYRKFLFLALTQMRVAPSKIVDKVWHEHILNTQNYHSMCESLKVPYLQHEPTYSEENLLECKKTYQETLNAYRRVFKEQPPIEWWGQMGSGLCTTRCNARCKVCRGCQRTCSTPENPQN